MPLRFGGNLTGPAGAGKSTIAAGRIRPASLPALRRRDSTVKAAAFLDATTTVAALNRELAQQLITTLGRDFKTEHTASRKAATANPGQASIDTELIGPLRAWPNAAGERVEIVLDGFDQLAPANTPAITDAIRALTTDDTLPLVLIIVTSRTDPPPELAGGPVLHLAGPFWAEVRRQVKELDVQNALPDNESPCLNGWLLGRLAAALTTPPRAPTLTSIVTTYLDDVLAKLPAEKRDLAILVLWG